MRVVIAPDSFKGTISATDAAGALAAGWRRRRPDDDVRLLPLADGGEGTLDVFAAVSKESVRNEVDVRGPDTRRVRAGWQLLRDGTAIVELAQSSGIALAPTLDPLGSHTIGLGDTIAAALDADCERLVIALGGSASTDGGTGALKALGARFFDAAGAELAPGGGALRHLARADVSHLRPPPAGGVSLLADVTAPLLGPTGAAASFGPQKGAGPAEIRDLERGLDQLARVVGGAPDAPGAGAAGGTSFGFATLWGAIITPGAATVAELVGLRVALDQADVVITGEGRFDATSFTGKVVSQVLADAPACAGVCVVAGLVAVAAPAGVGTLISLSGLAGSVAGAMGDPARWLAAAGEQLATRFPTR